MKILLTEDDPVIAENTRTLLTNVGYAVDSCGDSKSAGEKILSNDYDCAILDRNLPDGDGIDIVREARRQNITTPVLILTAYGDQEHTVDGLNSGADDYLAKPYQSEILLARVRALIRRGASPIRDPHITISTLTINTNTHEVRVEGKMITLSPKEYSLLEYLAYHPCQALDRVTLLTHAWDENIDLFSNTVDVHVRYLRRKLGRIAGRYIRTIKGTGYMLCNE